MATYDNKRHCRLEYLCDRMSELLKNIEDHSISEKIKPEKWSSRSYTENNHYYHPAKYGCDKTQSVLFCKMENLLRCHDSARLANGMHSYVIGRGLQDSNMVLVSLKVDDMAKAKAFAKDPGLKKAMQKGGVTGTPSFAFLTMTFQDTAQVASDIRSRTTFMVKDWSAWQKGFEDGKQERLDNGIGLRAFGHDVDNDKKVVLVTVELDSAKAFAYYKSDML